MNLRSWADKNNVVVGRHAHARTVSTDAKNQSDLFRLSDYRVSSVCAGTIWLVRREPLTHQENVEKQNYRNAATGMTIAEVENMLVDYKYDFGRDCLEEFLYELEAEERDAGRE